MWKIFPASRYSGRPVAEIMAEVGETWGASDLPVKTHYSSQDPDKRPGAHAYWLDPDDFRAFTDAMDGHTVDVMCECKGKDLAVRRLREELGGEW